MFFPKQVQEENSRANKLSQFHLEKRKVVAKCSRDMQMEVSRCKHVSISHTHTRRFNGPFSGTTQVSRYQKGKTYVDFTEARDSEWQWHQLGHMQVCTSLQRDNHTSTPPLCFLQAGCPSCRPTNSVRALKAKALKATCFYQSIDRKKFLCGQYGTATRQPQGRTTIEYSVSTRI